MFSHTLSLFTVALFSLAGSVHGTPLPIPNTVTLPLQRRGGNFTIKLNEILKNDLAWINSRYGNNKKSNGARAVSSASLTNHQMLSYTVPVKIGGTTYTLIFDTGSSTVFYIPTGASSSTNAPNAPGPYFDISYGGGEAAGTWSANSQITIGSVVVNNQGVGKATYFDGFSGVDGILGVGPMALTTNTVQDSWGGQPSTATYNTPVQNLEGKGNRIMGVSLALYGTPDDSSINGAVTFGGTDSTKYTGTLDWFTATGPWWGFTATAAYGSKQAMHGTGITDTGTTLIYLPQLDFSRYRKAIGATYVGGADLYSVSTTQYGQMSTLDFTINGKVYKLPRNGQVLPTAMCKAWSDPSSRSWCDYNHLLMIYPIGSGMGVDFILGQQWLSFFYSAYDYDHNRLGFATNPTTTPLP